MPDAIDKAIKQLADTKAPWVHRRDAAVYLGEAGKRAVGALNAHKADSDKDVQAAIQKALRHAAGGLAGIQPEVEPASYPIKELAEACEKPGQRSVKQEGDGYVVEVQLTKDRHQQVYLMPYARKDGAKLVRVFTYCGKPREDATSWALRANMKIPKGALALTEEQGEEHFVLVHCLPADKITPREVKIAVKAIAAYGDWIESKMTGLDEF